MEFIVRKKMISELKVVNPGDPEYIKQNKAKLMGTNGISSPALDICRPRANPSTGVDATGGTESGASNAISGTAQVTERLNETHQRLQERGEKLAIVSDKSAQLSQQSADFAKFAKQLKESNKSWF